MRRLFRDHYTDTMAFVGFTEREAMQDYERWLHDKPEWFLGYAVYVTACFPSRLEGLTTSAAIITNRALVLHPHGERAYDILERNLVRESYPFVQRKRVRVVDGDFFGAIENRMWAREGRDTDRMYRKV